MSSKPPSRRAVMTAFGLHLDYCVWSARIKSGLEDGDIAEVAMATKATEHRWRELRDRYIRQPQKRIDVMIGWFSRKASVRHESFVYKTPDDREVVCTFVSNGEDHGGGWDDLERIGPVTDLVRTIGPHPRKMDAELDETHRTRAV